MNTPFVDMAIGKMLHLLLAGVLMVVVLPLDTASGQPRGPLGPELPAARSSSETMQSRTVDISYSLRPSYGKSDLVIIVDALSLDDGQALLVETLLDDYHARFNEESQRVRVALQEARPGHIGGETLEGMQRGQEVMNQQIDAMREEMSKRLSEAETSEERAQIREEMSRQMYLLMQQGESVTDITGDNEQWNDFLQEQSRILAEWNTLRRQLDAELDGGLLIILEPESAPALEKVQMTIRRKSELPLGLLEGESLNLFSRVGQMQLEEERRAALAPAMHSYALELDQAIIALKEFRLDAAPVLSEALRTQDWGRAQAIIQDEAALRTRIRDLNLTSLNVVLQSLPEPQRTDLKKEIRKEVNASVWSKGRWDRALDAVIARDDLTDDERQSMATIGEQCAVAIDQVRNEQDMIYLQQEPARWSYSRQREWASSFPGVTFEGQLELEPLNELTTRRQGLEDECMQAMAEVIGKERFAQIPGARSSLNNQASRDERSERRATNAQDRRRQLYDQYDANNDGRLDTDERRAMREDLQEKRRGNQPRP